MIVFEVKFVPLVYFLSDDIPELLCNLVTLSFAHFILGYGLFGAVFIL